MNTKHSDLQAFSPETFMLAQALSKFITATTGKSPQANAPARYVTIDLAASLTGYTVRAIRAKVADGTWLEGKVHVRSPDGRVLIDMQGYAEWVEQGPGR